MTGPSLRLIRELLGLTQVGLATDLGVTGNTLARWERGLHPIPQWVAKLLPL